MNRDRDIHRHLKVLTRYLELHEKDMTTLNWQYSGCVAPHTDSYLHENYDAVVGEDEDYEDVLPCDQSGIQQSCEHLALLP